MERIPDRYLGLKVGLITFLNSYYDIVYIGDKYRYKSNEERLDRIKFVDHSIASIIIELKKDYNLFVKLSPDNESLIRISEIGKDVYIEIKELDFYDTVEDMIKTPEMFY